MTKKMLIVESSFNPDGVSNTASKLLQNNFSEAYGSENITVLNLHNSPVAHIDGTVVGAMYTRDEKRSDEQKQALELSDTLIQQLRDVDTVAFGTV